jgi:hypothetical protein
MTAMDKYGVNLGIEDCGVSIQYRPCLDLLNDELVFDSNGQVTQLYDKDCSTEGNDFENLVMIGLNSSVNGFGSAGTTIGNYSGPSRAF